MSVSPQHSYHANVEWGACEMWYAPKTWGVCFQLATTTDTGGEDLTAMGDGDKLLATARWKQVCDFRRYLQIQLLPSLRSLDLNNIFVWANGGGVIPFMQC